MISIAHPLVAVVRTALTPTGVRFIKRACAGKNERFDSKRRPRGKTPLAGRETQPRRAAPCRSEGLSVRLIGNVCVNAQPGVDLLTNSGIDAEVRCVIKVYRSMLMKSLPMTTCIARRAAALASGLPSQLYREIADTIPHMVWTARADSLLDYVNQRVSEYTGKTAKKLERSGWKPLIASVKKINTSKKCVN